ncbi:hypothetical protein Y032_0047g1439 [Ancylostoma ceylanicum]|uniref:Uncharacterized protein n=1 Tax=Ancylostoma ceylanicum TaxID=53326 RepID=A0A016UB07_9BILA|nr:hypothetical protein Y032_0047g1439 [Ancylostoma ceylanicum]
MFERIQNNFTRKMLIRTGSFLYSRIPGARLRTLECAPPKRPLFLGQPNRTKTIVHSTKCCVICSKLISCVGPKTTIRRVSFACRAGSSYLKLLTN